MRSTQSTGAEPKGHSLKKYVFVKHKCPRGNKVHHFQNESHKLPFEELSFVEYAYQI